MDDDWEALAEEENVVIAPKIPNNINKWEGEDEDDDVKESWEDEEEKKDEEKNEAQSTPSKSKSKKTLQPKLNDKERKQLEELNEQKETEKLANMTPEEKLAEKLRLQKIEKESDLKNALDTFGVSEPLNGLDGMHPTTKDEFTEFATALSNKIILYKNDDEFPGFIEELVRTLCANLPAADIKKVKITVDNLHLEAQKMEKEKTKKASGKGKTKIKLRVESDNIKSNNANDYGEGFDDYDDFM